MPNVSVVCFLASYAVALGAELSRLGWRNRFSQYLMWGMTAAGLIAHTLYLLLRNRQTDLPPLLSSVHDWLLVLAWLAVLIYLCVSVLDRQLSTGLVVLPLVLVLVIASYFVPDATDAFVSAHQSWTMLHVSLLVFGIGGILIGLAAAVMYLWQHYRLKHRQRMQPGVMLPSLERLERFTRLAILVSVPLLTIGMGLGIGLVVVNGGAAIAQRVATDPIIIGSAVCWLFLIGVFVWLLSNRSTPGRQVAWLSVAACGLLLLTMIGSQVLTRALRGTTVHGAAKPTADEPLRTLEEPQT